MSLQRHAPLAIHGLDAMKIRRVQTLHRLRLISLVVLLIMLAGAGIVLLQRHSQAKVLSAAAASQSRQYAAVVHADSKGSSQSLSLPGTLLGQIESPISARASGYLLRWSKDIGSTVKKGELLAEISTPEADQQLAQAQAGRQQAASAASLARLSAERWKNLLEQKAVSPQEADERRSAAEQATASLAAIDANIRRLQDLQSFSRIVAPFSGIITRRNVNVGDLIDANNNRPLFVLTQIDTLRVYVYVPQAYAGQIKSGQNVTLKQAELPGEKFEGKIIRTAGAIDPVTRSLQVEITIANQGGKLLPGAYVEVMMPASQRAGLTVPVNTLLLRGEGPRIAVLGKDGVVALHVVELGKDFGSRVEILSGISAADELVLNPSDALMDGDKLIVMPKK